MRQAENKDGHNQSDISDISVEMSDPANARAKKRKRRHKKATSSQQKGAPATSYPFVPKNSKLLQQSPPLAIRLEPPTPALSAEDLDSMEMHTIGAPPPPLCGTVTKRKAPKRRAGTAENGSKRQDAPTAIAPPPPPETVQPPTPIRPPLWLPNVPPPRPPSVSGARCLSSPAVRRGRKLRRRRTTDEYAAVYPPLTLPRLSLPRARSASASAQGQCTPTVIVEEDEQELKEEAIPSAKEEQQETEEKSEAEPESLLAAQDHSDADKLTVNSFDPDHSRSSVDSKLSAGMQQRMKDLKHNLRRRTSVVKSHVQRPVTPPIEGEDSSVADAADEAAAAARRRSLTSFVGYLASPGSTPASADRQPQSDAVADGDWLKAALRRCLAAVPTSIDKQNPKYSIWIGITSLALLYNAFGIPLRSSYPYQTASNLHYWLAMDYLCDLIYAVDLLFFKPRIRFIRGGLPVLDLCCLIPTDIAYFFFGIHPFVRVNRILKFPSYAEFFQTVESWFANPFILRIGRTISYMIYIVHCNSCVYYVISAWQAFGQVGYVDTKGKWLRNKWVYNGEGVAYVRCFYFTTKLATSIGNNAPPTNIVEYVYMWLSWMMGVFVFAVLLGQIRDIVANSNRNREHFRQNMDAALQQCKTLKVPPEVQDRVRQWFDYTWQEQKTMLQTDLAISVHYATLSKVQLFQDCDRALLRDLVLNLKPALFLPGDYICLKGEVGKEMYIVGKGILQVVGGVDNSQVFAELKEGSVFGEISLLAMGGGNRRTASIRSKGFSNLFVLSKQALNQALQDYPDAQKILKRKAREMLKKDEQKQEEAGRLTFDEQLQAAVSVPGPADKFVSTVVSVMDDANATARRLKAVIDEEHRKRSMSANSDSDCDDMEIESTNFLSAEPLSKAKKKPATDDAEIASER